MEDLKNCAYIMHKTNYGKSISPHFSPRFRGFVEDVERAAWWAASHSATGCARSIQRGLIGDGAAGASGFLLIAVNASSPENAKAQRGACLVCQRQAPTASAQ
jgi:hypothetical protein